jgi:DNA-binding NtrC family response regulator
MMGLKEKLSQFEIVAIKDALEAAGSVSGAARMLEVGRTTLIDKMKRYGIRSPVEKITGENKIEGSHSKTE